MTGSLLLVGEDTSGLHYKLCSVLAPWNFRGVSGDGRLYTLERQPRNKKQSCNNNERNENVLAAVDCYRIATECQVALGVNRNFSLLPLTVSAVVLEHVALLTKPNQQG